MNKKPINFRDRIPQLSEEHIKQICRFTDTTYIEGDWQRMRAYAEFKKWHKKTARSPKPQGGVMKTYLRPLRPGAKFTLINTLFFGIIGSLIGGVIPAILGSWSTFDTMMNRTDRVFVEYIFWSLMVGIVPASLAGFSYSRAYRKEFLKVGEVNFWKELKLAAAASFWAVTIVYYSFIALLMIDDYIRQGRTLEKTLEGSLPIISIGLFLIFLGVISGMACANLIREWNQKQAPNLS